MIAPSSKVQQVLYRSLLAVICSILLGMVFYRFGVFYRSHASFQFITVPITAGLFYNLLVTVRRRDAYLGLVILLFLTIVLTRSTTYEYLLRDVLHTAAIAAAVFLYVRYFRAGAEGNLFYPALMIAGLYGMLSVAAAELDLVTLWATTAETANMDAARLGSITAFFGVTIGFATGLGIGFGDRLWGVLPEIPSQHTGEAQAAPSLTR